MRCHCESSAALFSAVCCSSPALGVGDTWQLVPLPWVTQGHWLSTLDVPCPQWPCPFGLAVCQNCIEVDAPTISGIVIADVLATLFLAVAVYCISGHDRGHTSRGEGP